MFCTKETEFKFQRSLNFLDYDLKIFLKVSYILQEQNMKQIQEDIMQCCQHFRTESAEARDRVVRHLLIESIIG